MSCRARFQRRADGRYRILFTPFIEKIPHDTDDCRHGGGSEDGPIDPRTFQFDHHVVILHHSEYRTAEGTDGKVLGEDTIYVGGYRMRILSFSTINVNVFSKYP